MKTLVTALLLLSCGPLCVPVCAQNEFTAAQDIVRNKYNGIEATYSIVKAEKSTVHVKLRNTSRQSVIIELMITQPEGTTKLLPAIRIEPGRMEVRNIGDILSMTTSLGFTQPDEPPDKMPVTQLVDHITKKNDKLTSLKFGQQTAQERKKVETGSKGLSAAQARAVLELIFTKEEWAAAGPDITEEDKKMALIFLKDLVEKSCPMAVVEGIFHFQYAFDFTLLGLARYISNNVEENCLQKEYEMVRKTIAWKNKGAFENRKQAGEWLQ